MKLVRILQSTVWLTAATTAALPLAARAQVNIYHINGGISSTVDGEITDVGNSSGFSYVSPFYTPLTLGTLNDTIYFDSANLTVRQVGQFTPSAASTSVINETHVVGGHNVSATLTISQSVGTTLLDTGTLPVTWNSTTQTYTYANQGFWTSIQNIPITGSYTLVTGGQTLSGSFSYNLQPTGNGGAYPWLFRDFAQSPNKSSITLSDLGAYDGFVQGSEFLSVTADDGFQISLVPGNYDDRLQTFDFAGGDPTAISVVPEPGTFALLGLGLAGMAYSRRGKIPFLRR